MNLRNKCVVWKSFSIEDGCHELVYGIVCSDILVIDDRACVAIYDVTPSRKLFKTISINSIKEVFDNSSEAIDYCGGVVHATNGRYLLT